MRVLSWAGAVVFVVALGWGATSVVHPNPDSARALTASRHALAPADTYVGVGQNDPAPQRMIPRPSPDPSPTPPPAAPPAAAPVAAAPAHSVAPPPPAIVVGSTQQALINQDRARYGLPPLTWSSCLYNVAVSNAQRMAAQGFISHTNGPSVDLSCGLGHQGGENVGYWSAGVNDSQLNSMFMNSPDHRANILGQYHYVATAWAVGSNGYGYIAVEFS
jgi:uncharacterized protein YkwD